MIKPTIGRVVWYHQSGVTENEGQPLAAIVVFVHSDRMVNLAVFNRDGTNYGETSVLLIQGDEGPIAHEIPYRYCEWMPYQVGQAKKHAAEDKA